MATRDKDILDFMSTRPKCIGIIGYGSGINLQKGQENRKPQIDLIIIVDNLKQWHKQNMEMNPSDYSFSSKLFFRYINNNFLRNGGKICYMTYIPFGDREYKIGTIQKNDFLDDLDNWSTFYIAGRMQKPILVVLADDDINKRIDDNRKYAVMATRLINGNKVLPERDFYISLAGLSYIGDTRMGIAENPDKVKNIVDGSFDFYHDVYGKLIKINDGNVQLETIDIDALPLELKNYINSSDENDMDSVYKFLYHKNKDKSLSQTTKGLFTTGPVKSIKYVAEKIKRKHRK